MNYSTDWHGNLVRADVRKRGPRVVVGMVGKKRSGKDSFASTLVGEEGFVRFAFADPLRRAALFSNPIVTPPRDEPVTISIETADTFGLPRLRQIVERLGWEEAKEIREVRRTLQDYGVAIREIDEGFWVRATMGPALAQEKPVVITDVRFPNEVEAVRSAGGVVVRVVRPGMTNDDEHVSETALDGIETDVEIVNDGTLGDLAAHARNLADRLLTR